MYDNKKVLAIITARGGSKGLMKKNIKKLLDKPLIAWTIEAAKGAKYIDKCIVSTDDVEIKEISIKWGAEVPFMRPAELAMDDTASIDVVLDVLEKIPGFDYVLLLQPTSPLRTSEDIDEAISLCIGNGSESCVGVTEVEHSPYWMYTIKNDNCVQGILPVDLKENYQRQKLPLVYRINGAIYINTCEMLKREHKFINKKTKAYKMPWDRSCDIDNIYDFKLAEIIMKDRISGDFSGRT